MALLLAVRPAAAADSALMQPLGFSPDNAYFAFLEFGIQDGSGYAYANVYVIDLLRDVFVVGTPIREMAADDRTPLSTIIAQAETEAASHLKELAIDVPAQLLAANGDGARDNDGKSLDFGLPPIAALAPPRGTDRLTIESFKAPSGAPCRAWFGVDAFGYALSLESGGKTQRLHFDKNLPRSRGCPLTYKLYAAYAPFAASPPVRGVVLISVFAHGFEGVDRRFLAVPVPLDAVAAK